MTDSASLTDIALALYDVQGVKFGSFKLKSGIMSPIYIDLRVLVSRPVLLEKVSLAIYAKVQQANAKHDLICGVPYTALPMATVISLKHSVPMVLMRKEAKDYGTKQLVEGAFSVGQSCLVIEDIVTTGGSVVDVAETLKAQGLHVTDLAVFLDREQGGPENIAAKGYKLHTVLTISKLLEILRDTHKIDKDTYGQVSSFLKENSHVQAVPKPVSKSVPEPCLHQRADNCRNYAGKKLLESMISKQTNLCIAADVTTKKELLDLADKTGPFICMLKTHVDIISDFDSEFVQELTGLARKHNFLIFEDRKFADIGNTVKSQYAGGIFKIADWADITNCHVVSGGASVSALKKEGLAKERGLLLLAQMSTADANTSASTVSSSLEIASQNTDFVFGFICQQRLIPLAENSDYIYCAPGVNLADKGDTLGQKYNTPHDVIVEKGCDVIIVGRGITKATDVAAAAREYRDKGWKAYLERSGAVCCDGARGKKLC